MKRSYQQQHAAIVRRIAKLTEERAELQAQTDDDGTRQERVQQLDTAIDALFADKRQLESELRYGPVDPRTR